MLLKGLKLFPIYSGMTQFVIFKLIRYFLSLPQPKEAFHSIRQSVSTVEILGYARLAHAIACAGDRSRGIQFSREPCRARSPFV